MGKRFLRGTPADTYRSADFRKLVLDLYAESRAKPYEQLWHSIITFCHATLVRSDDLRKLTFGMALPPEHSTAAGPCPPQLFSFALTGGKTCKASKVHLLHLTRALDCRMCPVSSLARLLFLQFTRGQRSVPNPSTDWDAWVRTPWFALSNKPLTYENMRRRIKAMFQQHNIAISKVCHAFRAGGAQAADLSG